MASALLPCSPSPRLNPGPLRPAAAPLRTLRITRPKWLSVRLRSVSPCPRVVVSVLGPQRKGGALQKTTKPPEPKTEDGLFGFSSGYGFTKEGALRVGRMAMLGLATSLLGEAVLGKGILAQLQMETGVNLGDAHPGFLLFVLGTVMAAVGGLGDRGRFVYDEPTVANRSGAVRGILGLDDAGPLFGFTKVNELFIGRVAQLGVAASLVGELVTGRGALALLNVETGVPLREMEPLVLLCIFFFFAAAVNPGTGKFITEDEK